MLARRGSALYVAGHPMHWANLGLKANIKENVRDVWSKTDIGTFTASFTATAEVHGVRGLAVSVFPSIST